MHIFPDQMRGAMHNECNIHHDISLAIGRARVNDKMGWTRWGPYAGQLDGGAAVAMTQVWSRLKWQAQLLLMIAAMSDVTDGRCL